MNHLKPTEHYGDIYQDVRVKGEIVYPGWRDCDGRWNTIKPHIPANSVVMDLGSNAGYFSQRIAEEINNSMVWSMESVPARWELQRDMLLENGTPNVVLTSHKMDIFDFLKLQYSVNRIDVIVALNVLEYYPPKELFEVLNVFSRISPLLIVEFPSLEESGAASSAGTVVSIQPVDKYLRRFYNNVKKIGEAPSSTDPTMKRDIYCCVNTRFYSENLVGYLTHSGLAYGGRRHTLGYGGVQRNWVLDGNVDLTDTDPAVNLCNLTYFGMEYPTVDVIYPQIVEAYQAVAEKYETITDVHIRNVLCTSNGVAAIDVLEHYAKAVVYGRHRDGEDGYDKIFPGYLNGALAEIKAALLAGKEGGA